MPDFTFRLHFRMAAADRLGFTQAKVLLTLPGIPSGLTLCTPDLSEPLAASREIICRGSGFTTEAEARAAGEHVRDALMATFARLDMGADFGERAPQSFFTRAGLALVEESVGRRTLNDIHGLMTFESEPQPGFVQLGPGQLLRTMQHERLQRVLEEAVKLEAPVSKERRLAFELYNASFFEAGARARFLSLMTAVEALLPEEARSAEARRHLDTLVELTSANAALDAKDRQALCGALGTLYHSSTKTKALKLAESLPPERRYDDLPARDFYERCHAARNRMVHGAENVEEQLVGRLAANLEVFVSHLLGDALRHVDA